MDVTEFPESLCRLCLMPTPSASLTELRTGDNRDNSVTSKINTLIGKDIVRLRNFCFIINHKLLQRKYEIYFLSLAIV